MSHRPQHHLKEHEGGGKHGAREQREPAGTPAVRRPRGRREARPRRQQTPQERRPATWKARPRSSAGRMGRGGGARRRGGAAAAWGGAQPLRAGNGGRDRTRARTRSRGSARWTNGRLRGDGGTSSRGVAPRQPAVLWPPRGRRLPSPALRAPLRARAATLRHECARDGAVARARGSESAAWRLRRRYCAQGRAEEHARCRSAWGVSIVRGERQASMRAWESSRLRP